MKLYKHADRGKIYTRIYIYKERREKLRQRYGVTNGMRPPRSYT